MDYNVLMTAIGTVGFPIVMCIILIWMMKTTLSDLTKSIDNNTNVVQQLLNKLNNK